MGRSLQRLDVGSGIAGCTSAVDCNTPTATNIATGWRSWNLDTYQTNPATAVDNAQGGSPATTTVLPTPPVMPAPTAAEGTYRIMTDWNLDDYVARVHATTATFPISSYDLLQVDSTDLRPFRAHGGIGRDYGTTLTDDYRAPFVYPGGIRKVTLDLID